jgi:hypothetical protein
VKGRIVSIGLSAGFDDLAKIVLGRSFCMGQAGSRRPFGHERSKFSLLMLHCRCCFRS